MEIRNPLASIIVRTKDRPGILTGALRSIASQDYRPIEAIVVNDGGCDLDTESLKKVLSDVRLKYLRLEKNLGRAASGNAGINASEGRYIGFLDDDDEFLPNHVSTLVSFLQANPGYRGAYTDSLQCNSKYDPKSDRIVDIDGYVYYSQDFSYNLLLLENYIPINNLLFERSALMSAGGFDTAFELYEDWDLLLRVVSGGEFYHIAKVTSKVRQWSQTEQVTLRYRDTAFDRESYAKLMIKHSGKITSETLYNYFVTSGTRRGNWLKLKLENERLEEKHRNLTVKFENLSHYSQSLSFVLSEVRGSMGWKLLESYRRLKDRVFPPKTRRRIFYESALKAVKTVHAEGWRSLFDKLGRRLRTRAVRAGSYKGALDAASLYSGFAERRPVDIIIPVYNGIEDLAACMESLIASTDLCFHRLTIIDDASTEEKMHGYLTPLSGANGKNIDVLFNGENLGFVKTVNRGMAGSAGDVLILNSDTVVTPNWLEKMQRAAYSKHRVATVTPFSNHAYLCSIPEPLKYNFLPPGFDVRSFGDFIERISLRYYPEVPFGSGFCLYIKRDAIKSLGLFDEDLFEKGYGEDTDFCMRANKIGLINIVDDSTYIYHKGGVSFESNKNPGDLYEKNKMIERNLARLRARHPEYDSSMKEAVETNLRPVLEYLRLRLNGGRK
jgi:GT2 family glycosyltransferase